MQRLSFILVTILLAGCASGPLSKKSDIDSGSQQQGMVISCSGYKSWADCDRAATNSCPKGYDVISKDENLVTQGRTMRINCK
jgi:hypothetical protein